MELESDQDIPTAKFLSNLAKVPTENKQRLVCLITTGAYCPIHIEHEHLLDLAKAHLESKDCIVLAGFGQFHFFFFFFCFFEFLVFISCRTNRLSSSVWFGLPQMDITLS
jgi:hypothetical protein